MESQNRIYLECKTVESIAEEMRVLSQKLDRKAEELRDIYRTSDQVWEGTAADQYNYKLRRYSDKAKEMSNNLNRLSLLLLNSSRNLSFADQQGATLFQGNNGGTLFQGNNFNAGNQGLK